MIALYILSGIIIGIVLFYFVIMYIIKKLSERGM